MARFEALHTKIWRDPDFYEWQTDEKLAFLWLLTNEQATQSGLQEVHPAVMAAELKTSESRAEEILRLFAQAGKVEIDGRLVWIVRRFDYRPNSPKVRESALRDLRLHARSRLTQRFWERYKHLWPEAEREGVHRELEALWRLNGQTVEPPTSKGFASSSPDGPIQSIPIQSIPLHSDSSPNRSTPAGEEQIDVDGIRAGMRHLVRSKDLNRALRG